MKFWICAICIFLTMTCTANAAEKPSSRISVLPPKTVEQIAENASPSVVSIIIFDGVNSKALGSGFVVGPGLIATCAHVIANQSLSKLKIVFNGESYNDINSMVAVDWDHDLAILSCGFINTKPLVMNFTEAEKIGDPVVSISSPDAYYGTVFTGIVSHWRVIGGVKVLQVTAPVSPGSSGSPLFDQFGRVIGISASIALMSNGVPLPGVSMAVSSRYLRTMLDHIGLITDAPAIPTDHPNYAPPETEAFSYSFPRASPSQN